MHSIFVRLPLLHKVLIGFFSALIIFALFFLPDPQDLDPQQSRLKVGQHYPVPVSLELSALNSSSPAVPAVLRWETYKVKNGESAAILFSRVGLSARLLHELVSSDKEVKKQLTRLRPGDRLQFGFDENNDLVQLRRTLSAFETFRITLKDGKYVSEVDKKEVDFQYNYAEATIKSNFWNAGISSGLNGNQIMELAGIFGWDIDFALDIRKNDSFRVLYQEEVVEGEVIGRGKIIAAIFKNQGDTFTAILDQKSGKYYDENGRAMKKAFLRAPLDFRRVSSNFNPRRLHPVTGRVRPHRGTDYAAPVGTPIWAAGDGVVQKSSYNKFNGNYVFIKHSNTYITKYLHLTKRTVRAGQRVKQGQTIGTLGGTGRVTGPHLHYEFLVNGVHKNPRTVNLPQSKSLTGKARQTFMANAKISMDKLERYSKLLAMK
ncbi:peptidoglycan DD-metalloendopeptidase family protein [Vibrio alginolyticus]|uniref:peptidoglycan DD-metalloendopeptidase family protein n=1 Tax=Vibrio alginolyticus TaxID=663 RepID=UPI001BD5C994|nr:peptidoglycan DD-metalloendopeptidase family protein [Vibrio alginolyticus]EGQ8486898.1 peptidoglycan DD-metalloendopeptidase family protein [Vibrio alginolyticus]EKP4439539.1 peptidoglycan DD-metalloendopeptidase family protein [Vibrio alginolyticus]ELA6792061.1 peptidoglycan DD-metalloendopeptidase family protein [Vibrio alginolyticus]ELA8375514.1 peptidoglycan DD-metalloendopeptidase family protein [Vibrio alginolyticus]ELB2794508.1 peptidoglycan DD-metalloendopeptidase family protein [V